MPELTLQIAKPLRHFAKHLFITGRVFRERENAREDVYSYLQKMRKSIIRMNLSYSEVDRLKQKIDNLVVWERKYAKFFRPEDSQMQELKNQIKSLEDGLSKEREEKLRIQSEQEEKIRELSDSLESIKHKMRHLFMEKSKRHHRLMALESKINKNSLRKF